MNDYRSDVGHKQGINYAIATGTLHCESNSLAIDTLHLKDTTELLSLS